MGFLRLGVQCAVINDDGEVLLSQRGDLGVWNLPGGRLDSGEPLTEAAAREVFEETGVQVADVQPVNLYYASGWSRMNILFRARPIGGRLQLATDEARDNRYFSPDSLPPNTLWPFLVADALADSPPLPYALHTPPDELRRVKWQLRRRWVMNLLRGRPEPRYVRFNVQASALIFDDKRQYVLTMEGARARVLPRVVCEGDTPPWEQLSALLTCYGVSTTPLQWAGVWQNVTGDSFEFVFSAILPEDNLPDGMEWSPVQNAALMGQDAGMLSQTLSHLPQQKIWLQLYWPERFPLVLEQK